MRTELIGLTSILALAGTTHGGVAIDGMWESAYGPAIAVQTVETGFGDNFSEWNAVYAFIDAGRLNVLVTGNLESNFNKLEVFIDSRGGGENTMLGTPEYDFFNGANWISSNLVGMTFDTGFDADYHMYARTGGATFEVDFIDRLGGGGVAVNGNAGVSAYDGILSGGSVDPGNLANGTAVGNALTESILYAMDNSNVAGIGGGNSGAAADQAAAAAVTTGFEFSIALADLAVDGTEIRLAIMQNNGDHNYLSNQNFEGLPIGTGNLGGDGAGGFTGDLSGIDFNNFGGTQFITVAVGATCIGDVDGNGSVGFSDLLGVLAAWGSSDPAFDVDGNGTVGFSDVLEILANWGPC